MVSFAAKVLINKKDSQIKLPQTTQTDTDFSAPFCAICGKKLLILVQVMTDQFQKLTTRSIF